MQENRVRSSRHPISNSGTERTPARSGTAASAPNLKLGAEEYISPPQYVRVGTQIQSGGRHVHTAYPRCPFGHPDSDWGPKRTPPPFQDVRLGTRVKTGCPNGPSPPHRKGGRKTRPPLMILFVPQGLRPTLSGPGATPKPEASPSARGRPPRNRPPRDRWRIQRWGRSDPR